MNKKKQETRSIGIPPQVLLWQVVHSATSAVAKSSALADTRAAKAAHTSKYSGFNIIVYKFYIRTRSVGNVALTYNGRVGAGGARRVTVVAAVRVGSAGGVSGGGRSAGGRDGDAGGPAGERPQLLCGEPLRASVGASVGDHCTEVTARNGGSQKSTLVNRSAQAFECAIPE